MTSTPDPVVQPTGRQFATAVAWTAGAKWLSQVISWVSLVVIVNLLTPDDYGIYGVGTTYLGLLAIVAEFGIAMSVVAIRDLTNQQLAALNSLAVILGVAVVAISAPLSYLAAWFFRLPQLQSVVVAISFSFLITSFRTVPSGMLQKQMRFGPLSVSEALQSIVQALVTLGLAYAGAGYWALTIGVIAGAAAATGAVMIWSPCGFAKPIVSRIDKALKMSWGVMVQRVCWYTYTNADFTIAAKVLGAAPAGAYTIAATLASLPADKIGTIIMKVTPSFFASMQENKAGLRRYVLVLTGVLSAVMVPVIFGTAAVATDLVPVVLGPKWILAIIPLQLLAINAFFRSNVALLAQMLTVSGDVKFGARTTLMNAIVLPPAFYIGSYWGINGIAAVWAFFSPIISIPWYTRTFQKLELRPLTYWQSIAPAFVSSAIMVIMVLTVKYIMSGYPIMARLIAEVAVGVVAYPAAAILLFPDRIREYYTILKNLRGQRKPNP
jgi:O-antigen/teichoic acid export membrane protein